MPSPKIKLEEAIKNNNMEYVREYYHDMYDQEAPEIEKENQDQFLKIQSLATQFFQLISLDSHSFNLDKFVEDLSPEETILIVEKEVDSIPNRKKKTRKKTSGKPKGRAVTGSVPSMETEEYKKALEEHSKSSKNKETRDPYTPYLKNCDKCGEEFDYAKEYPSTMTESNSILCFDCDRKNSKNRK